MTTATKPRVAPRNGGFVVLTTDPATGLPWITAPAEGPWPTIAAAADFVRNPPPSGRCSECKGVGVVTFRRSERHAWPETCPRCCGTGAAVPFIDADGKPMGSRL